MVSALDLQPHSFDLAQVKMQALTKFWNEE